MFISIKGRSGKYNAVVIPFYKNCIDDLKYSISRIYMEEFDKYIPPHFHNINTIKGLKEFVKNEMKNMDNYPFGFKYIDGVFCLYSCVG